VEGGILPPRTGANLFTTDDNFTTLRTAQFFPPGWEARLYGRQGCPPPHPQLSHVISDFENSPWEPALELRELGWCRRSAV
jgi:hypothetical protein